MTIFFKTSEILEAAYEGYGLLPTRKKQKLSKELKETLFNKKRAQQLWNNNYGSESNPLPKKLIIIEHVAKIEQKYGVKLHLKTGVQCENMAKWAKI